MTKMSYTLPLLLVTLQLLVTSQASPVNITSQYAVEQLSPQQTAMLFSEVLKNVAHALQLIDLSVTTDHENITSFEYCYISGYANPPAADLTIDDRLSYDYQLLEELILPLEGVLNYEATQSGNDSITYQRLAVALRQLNTSLIEIQSIQSNHVIMEQLTSPGGSHEQVVDRNATMSAVEDKRCNNVVSNSIEKYRDLIEVKIGLHYAVWDLMDMENEPHSFSK